MKWSDIKKKGSQHYKGDKVEPIDLFKEGGMLWDWCMGEIIAKAYRNRAQLTIDVPGPSVVDVAPIVIKDMKKIIHYAEMIISILEEEEEEWKSKSPQLKKESK